MTRLTLTTIAAVSVFLIQAVAQVAIYHFEGWPAASVIIEEGIG